MEVIKWDYVEFLTIEEILFIKRKKNLLWFGILLFLLRLQRFSNLKYINSYLDIDIFHFYISVFIPNGLNKICKKKQKQKKQALCESVKWHIL